MEVTSAEGLDKFVEDKLSVPTSQDGHALPLWSEAVRHLVAHCEKQDAGLGQGPFTRHCSSKCQKNTDGYVLYQHSATSGGHQVGKLPLPSAWSMIRDDLELQSRTPGAPHSREGAAVQIFSRHQM
ncbi:Hypothetical predicted protein [Podarcis lilfordi]|uniref:Uncharacterized protein n=1 Tax=Podarcis lilfordi TaxID=74358 RepID=A0AA35LF19_9SAUR|nr:Hypothetical predicted protein [Podarcis lilfordi]